MTTGGEGGMVTTNDRALWLSTWAQKDHGKSWEAVYEREHAPGFRWLHESFGDNWRMLEMQAVLGRIQLGKMHDWHRQRAANAEAIMAAARACPALRVPHVPEFVEHAWYKAYVQVRPEALTSGWSRDRIMSQINALGVPCYSGSCSEMYLEKAFDGTPYRPAKRLSVAKELGETSLMFLVHPTLSIAQIEKSCKVLTQVMHEATR